MEMSMNIAEYVKTLLYQYRLYEDKAKLLKMKQNLKELEAK